MLQLIAQSGSSSGGGSILGLLLPLALMGGIFYLLILRPQRARQRQQDAILRAVEVGDEVMTAGGMFGTVMEIDEETDTVVVEIAPGTNVRMLRKAIAQRFIEEGAGDGGSGETGTAQ